MRLEHSCDSAKNAGVNSMRHGDSGAAAGRLVRGIAEDYPSHLAVLHAYDEPELLGDEIPAILTGCRRCNSGACICALSLVDFVSHRIGAVAPCR